MVNSIAGDYFWGEFMMNEYKIRTCDNCRGCPWAHAGDCDRRRDHSRHCYSFEPCRYFSQTGSCPYGDLCWFAHGYYETCYHPHFYRVFACPYRRCPAIRLCPYAHSREQDRSRSILTQGSSSSVAAYINQPPRMAYQNSAVQGSSSPAAADSNQPPRLAYQNSAVQGPPSSVARRPSYSLFGCRNLQPCPPSPPPMMRRPNSQTLPPPPPPMMQQSNSPTLSPPPQRPQNRFGPIGPRRVQPPSPTDSSAG